MHLLFGIICTALIIQVSLAGPLEHKDYAVEGLKGLYELSKDLVRATEPAVRGALKNIPKINTYTKYSQELEGYLAALNQYKTKPGPCLEKTFELLQEFLDMLQNYAQENAAAEAKKVMELLEEYSDDDLEKKLAAWEEKFKDTNLEEDVQHIDGLKIAGIMKEVC